LVGSCTYVPNWLKVTATNFDGETGKNVNTGVGGEDQNGGLFRSQLKSWRYLHFEKPGVRRIKKDATFYERTQVT